MTSISKLIVGGFKSIRERTEIPIAPLTLLFGPNSAGKSSVMDAMDALRQRLKDALSLHASNVMSASEDLNRIIVNIDPQAHRIAGVAIRHGGVLSGEHGIGSMKVAFMAEAIDPVTLAVLRDVKAALDPEGHLNPGKVLPEAEDATHA